MNEIKEFLAAYPYPEQFPFEEGLALLKKYQANPGVISFIERGRRYNDLASELGRFSRYTNLTPIPGYIATGAADAAPEAVDVTPATEQKKEKDIIQWEDLKQRYENTRYDDMPTDYLKKIWKEGQQLHHELQFAHLKMVEAATEEEGEEWRKKTLSLNKKLRENWAIIDAEIGRVKSGSSSEGQFKESSCRAYITKALKKEKLSSKDIVEIRKRVEQLQQHGCKFNDELTKKLKKIQVL